MEQPLAFCRPCDKPMEILEDEPMGRTYICRSCNITVSLGQKRPVIEVDRMPRQEPIGTTLNGHHHS